MKHRPQRLLSLLLALAMVLSLLPAALAAPELPEIVLPNGDIINTAPVPKHSGGPNLVNMFVGSEGTLGVMTKCMLKMVRLPEVRRHH